MKTDFRKSFERDLKKVKDNRTYDDVKEAIHNVEQAGTLFEIAGLKKLSGSQDCYRIKVGEYRLGITVEDDTVAFIRCLHRRDIYKSFP